MGMDVILNQRIDIPAVYHPDDIHVSIVSDKFEVPKFDTSKICSMSIRLGTFSGYELAEFLNRHTGDIWSNGNDWFFCQYDAEILLNSIDDVLTGKGDLPKDVDAAEEFLREILKFKAILEEALTNGADCFEILLSY
jgi:hypothetical protein